MATSMKNLIDSSSTIRNLVLSATGTTLAEIITMPICTIKTNYQNTNTKSVIDLMEKMYLKNGIVGFYAASPAAVMSQVISTASKYTFYRYLEDQQFKYSNKVINGLISGIISSVVTHPLDTIKIHLQMGTPFIPELRNHGLKLFYRGYSKTFTKVCVGSSLFFPIYDYSNNLFKNSFYAAMTSSVISTTLMHPVDYLKTRHIYGQNLYEGWDPRIYYKGLLLNLARVVPHFVIIMTTIEYFKNKI